MRSEAVGEAVREGDGEVVGDAGELPLLSFTGRTNGERLHQLACADMYLRVCLHMYTRALTMCLFVRVPLIYGVSQLFLGCPEKASLFFFFSKKKLSLNVQF